MIFEIAEAVQPAPDMAKCQLRLSLNQSGRLIDLEARRSGTHQWFRLLTLNGRGQLWRRPRCPPELGFDCLDQEGRLCDDTSN